MVKYKNKYFIKYKSNQEIKNAINNIALSINEKHKNNHVYLIGILNGCMPFLNELIHHLKISFEYNFIKISSYRGMKRSNINLDLDVSNKDIKNKDVIIIEDIIDSGKTIKFLNSHLNKYNPKSISVASLIIKPKSINLSNWYGFILKNNKYVIGYGMDINNLFRQLRDIYIEKR